MLAKTPVACVLASATLALSACSTFSLPQPGDKLAGACPTYVRDLAFQPGVAASEGGAPPKLPGRCPSMASGGESAWAGGAWPGE